MTVKLLSQWGAQPAGSLYSASGATETAMIAAGVATATLTGATPWPAAQAVTVIGGGAPSALYRIAGGISGLDSSAHGHHLSFQAPGHFDGVRIVLLSSSNTTTGIKASVAAPAYMSGVTPKTAAGANVSLTAVTWGNTDPKDFRDVGGDATIDIANAAGSSQTLREGYAVSDYIALPSTDRADVVGAPPVFCLRLYGTNVALLSNSTMDSAGTNPASSAIPQLLSGYWGNDYTATSAPGEFLNQGNAAAVAVIFFLRGAMVSLGVAGDSIEMGWANSAVNGTIADIDGWPRQFARLLNLNGTPANYCALNQAGEASYVFHQRAYNALTLGGLTHLFVKPWSVNDGDASTVGAAISRTTQILDLALRTNVKATVIRPWAGQSINSVGAAVQTYCDQVVAAGGRVFDARRVVESSSGSDVLRTDYLTRDSGGSVIDFTHPNGAAHTAIAAHAFADIKSLGF